MLIKILLFILMVILYSGTAMIILDSMYIGDEPDKIGIVACCLWPLLLVIGSIYYWVRLTKKAFDKIKKK